MENEVYTVEEVADILGVTKVSVRNYINSGKLKANVKRKGLSFSFEIPQKSILDFQEKYLK